MNYKLFSFACALNLFYYVPNLLASPIVGGREDTSHAYRYHVSIQKYYATSRVPYLFHHFCGGAIIHDRFILSAAHCFLQINNRQVVTRQPRRDGIIVLSGTSVTHGTGIITQVDKIFISHDFYEGSFADVSVLKLLNSLDVAQHTDILEILPIDDGRRHTLDFFVNKNALVLGNGLDTLLVNGRPVRRANRRQVLDVLMISKDLCPGFDYGICAVSLDTSHIGTCVEGDNGSPIVYENTIIGVLSLVPIDLCRSGESMVFARTSTSIHFIQNAMDENGDHSNMYKLKH